MMSYTNDVMIPVGVEDCLVMAFPMTAPHGVRNTKQMAWKMLSADDAMIPVGVEDRLVMAFLISEPLGV
jgi:hypothetical protein